VEKTYYPKASEIDRAWYLIDANDQILGRLASQISSILLGKHKPTFTPGVDVGDYVVVVNASHVRVTGNKMTDKIYHWHTGYPSGLKSVSLRDQLGKYPDRVIRSAVWGMLPHNKLGRKLLKNLKVYGGPRHPHKAQKIKPFTER
jgi:large subunit ribosomal protein L13